MATQFNLSVVAPDRTITEEPVNSVSAPAFDGYIGILAGHEPMIVALRPGVLEYRDARDQLRHVALGGGFMEISGTSVIVLADDAQMAQEIDIREAELALEQARKALRGEESSVSREDATLELERALTRIRAAKRA